MSQSVSVQRPNSVTTVTTIVKVMEKNPLQLDLFEDYSATFFKQAMAVMANFPKPFWFSELRITMDKMGIAPVHKNHYGTLTRVMRKNGYRQTGRYRPSPIKSLRGSCEFEWTKGDAS